MADAPSGTVFEGMCRAPVPDYPKAAVQALGNLFSWLVTAMFGAITLLLGYETWALITDHAPITTFIRAAVHSYPGIAFVVALVLGMLLGHFLWGPARGRTSPTGESP